MKLSTFLKSHSLFFSFNIYFLASLFWGGSYISIYTVERERAHRAHFLSLGKGGLMTLISKSFDWNLCK